MSDANPICPQERFARQIVRTLSRAGHIAYFAGGCVRDRLLGRTPKDFDVATDATPQRIRELFGKRRTLPIGVAFGVIAVLGDKQRGEHPIEVATFRTDGNYTDGRRPDSVVYATPEQDALRRDFTINGLFYDPDSDAILDYVGGLDDLSAKVIRAIGNAHDRIAEDKLRMLRAVRIATHFNFQVESRTLAAVRAHADQIGQVSSERIGAEMRRLLASPAADDGLELLISTRLAGTVFPSLQDAWLSAVQPWEHSESGSQTAAVVTKALLRRRAAYDFVSGLTICLYGIQLAGGDPMKTLCDVNDRWRLSNDEVAEARYGLDSLSVVAQAHRLPWSRVQPTLIGRFAGSAVALARVVCAADGSSLQGVSLCECRLDWDRACLDPPPLITGETLQGLGLKAGPRFKEILQTVRNKQLDAELTCVEDAIRFVDQNFTP